MVGGRFGEEGQADEEEEVAPEAKRELTVRFWEIGGRLGGQSCWRMSAEVWRRARLGAVSWVMVEAIEGR